MMNRTNLRSNKILLRQLKVKRKLEIEKHNYLNRILKRQDQLKIKLVDRRKMKVLKPEKKNYHLKILNLNMWKTINPHQKRKRGEDFRTGKNKSKVLNLKRSMRNKMQMKKEMIIYITQTSQVII
jgi:hypothetical protein